VKTKAAIVWGLNQKWEVEEVDVDGPKRGEVLVKLDSSGLCRSDDHLVTGDMPMPLPAVGGHEGAGTVIETGPGVTDVAEGDAVIFSFLPACGKCPPCRKGWGNLCDVGAAVIAGPQLDGTYRFHARGQDVGQMCVLGAFSEYTTVPMASVVKIEPDIPLDKAALVGCGVATGYGSAVYAGETKPGDVVVVMGVGGIGINAVQGARIAGASAIVALDPVEYKRIRSKEFGATHAAATVEEAGELVADLTRGRMADVCVVSTDHAEGRYVGEGLGLVGKRGRVVMTAIPHPTDTAVDLSLFDLTMYEKQVRGAVFGSSNPHFDIAHLLDLYRRGLLELDALVTREYALDAINQGYDDMRDGKNVRGIIRF
jgi:S-(hydroxymethyl)glutathione dehydrogenase/alcohol dehydrogenase